MAKYTARKGRIVVQEKETLALFDKNLSHETINLINAFYEVDEFSKQMLGKKDYVSAFRNTHKQK